MEKICLSMYAAYMPNMCSKIADVQQGSRYICSMYDVYMQYV